MNDDLSFIQFRIIQNLMCTNDFFFFAENIVGVQFKEGEIKTVEGKYRS